jgi:DNA-directed RNA polymerase subunit RPC12/RpoP
MINCTTECGGEMEVVDTRPGPLYADVLYRCQKCGKDVWCSTEPNPRARFRHHLSEADRQREYRNRLDKALGRRTLRLPF